LGAAALDPFSGSREVFMGSLNEPRCLIRLGLTLATLQFRCIFTHSWSGGRLRVAKMVLWLGGQRIAEGKAKVDAFAEGNRGRRLTSEALLEVIE
jgi:hypothetical protein